MCLPQHVCHLCRSVASCHDRVKPCQTYLSLPLFSAAAFHTARMRPAHWRGRMALTLLSPVPSPFLLVVAFNRTAPPLPGELAQVSLTFFSTPLFSTLSASVSACSSELSLALLSPSLFLLPRRRLPSSYPPVTQPPREHARAHKSHSVALPIASCSFPGPIAPYNAVVATPSAARPSQACVNRPSLAAPPREGPHRGLTLGHALLSGRASSGQSSLCHASRVATLWPAAPGAL